MSDLTAVERGLEDAIESIVDPETAFEVAKKLLEDAGDDRPRLSKYHAGQKRHPGFKKMVVRPLKGVTPYMSNKIRMVIALRYAEVADAQIEKALGLHPRWIWKHESAHPEAFLEARSDIVKLCVQEYHENVAFARCAVSQMGMKACETLAALMDDPNAADGIRLKAAMEVLKLTFTGPPSEKSVAEGVIHQMGDALSKIVTASKGDRAYIYDAEEVENDGTSSLGAGS